jgi:hypothetical protein
MATCLAEANLNGARARARPPATAEIKLEPQMSCNKSGCRDSPPTQNCCSGQPHDESQCLPSQSAGLSQLNLAFQRDLYPS